jgi:hypothetical protein
VTAPTILGLVLVEWVDSRQCERGWRWLDTTDRYRPTVVRSVGWLVDQPNPETIVLAPALSEPDEDGDRQAMGVGVIPAAAVLRKWQLQMPYEPSEVAP